LGSVALTWRTSREASTLCDDTLALTGRPFAVNYVLAWPQRDRVALALDAGIRIVWTAWGSPEPHVAEVHSAGGILLHTVGSLEEARTAVDAGVDVLVVQGVEAGGHVRGRHPARELLRQVRDILPAVPAAVAGGIATGAHVAGALTDGAAGVVLGTRFVCSREANVAPLYQQAILAASVGDTLLTELFDKGWPGAPHRVLRNSTVRRWAAAGYPAAGSRPGERDVVAHTREGAPVERYSDVIPTGDMTGDLEALPLYAGESSAFVDDILPAAEIVQRLVHDAADSLQGIGS